MAIESVVKSLRKSYAGGRLRSLSERKVQLEGLERLLLEQESLLVDALHKDLRKSSTESWLTEIGPVLGEVRLAKEMLRNWACPEVRSTPLASQPGKSSIVREAYGVVLVMGPWNYPVNLMLAPLVGALSAGNCVVLKPSEVAPHTAAILAREIPRYLDSDCVAVIEGGPSEAEVLLGQRFDKIFYTGGERVGRIVLESAAQHLTPVTLELGGKSPCYVDGNVDLKVTARRIVWGKYMNVGQTCVAPDYVLVHQSREKDLLDALTFQIGEMFGDDPRQSSDYGRIVSEAHHQRLVSLLEGSGTVATGGSHDASDLYFAPTVLTQVPADAPAMKEEIFGPLLPVLPVSGTAEAKEFITQREKPLALYVFTRDESCADEMIMETSSGAVCINEVMAHLANPELPFGGVGNSGMGAYHGRHSFEEFSHRKAVLKRGTRFDFQMRYPPYTSSKLGWLRRLLPGWRGSSSR